MNQGKYIFAQLTDFLSRRQFDNIHRCKIFRQQVCEKFHLLESDALHDLRSVNGMR